MIENMTQEEREFWKAAYLQCEDVSIEDAAQASDLAVKELRKRSEMPTTATGIPLPWVCGDCRCTVTGSTCIKCGKPTEHLNLEVEYAKLRKDVGIGVTEAPFDWQHELMRTDVAKGEEIEWQTFSISPKSRLYAAVLNARGEQSQKPPAPDPIVVKAMQMGLEQMGYAARNKPTLDDFISKYGCHPMSNDAISIFQTALAKMGVEPKQETK